MTTNGNVKKFISQERVWLSEVRTEMNKLFDKYLARLDEMEVRIQKEQEVAKFAENCKTIFSPMQPQAGTTHAPKPRDPDTTS